MDAIKKTENYINNQEDVKQTKPSLRGKGLHFFFSECSRQPKQFRIP